MQLVYAALRIFVFFPIYLLFSSSIFINLSTVSSIRFTILPTPFLYLAFKNVFGLVSYFSKKKHQGVKMIFERCLKAICQKVKSKCVKGVHCNFRIPDLLNSEHFSGSRIFSSELRNF
jgi:hypothetical protein